MQIYYDSDADQNIAKGMEIVIIGYGSQGHAHANNLKDSGANVTVALRKESGSWAKAEAAGFDVKEVGEAVPNADLVMMLIPDEKQSAMYENHLKDNIKDDIIATNTK